MTFSVCLVLSQCIEGVIGGTDYNQSKVNQWTASIVEHSLSHLVKQGRPFKYIGELTTPWRTLTWDLRSVLMRRARMWMFIYSLWCFTVNCTIMQKSGAGLHTANSCYWDTATDGEKKNLNRKIWNKYSWYIVLLELFPPGEKCNANFLCNASYLCLFQEAAQSGGRIAPCTVLSVCLLWLWRCDSGHRVVLCSLKPHHVWGRDTVTKKII